MFELFVKGGIPWMTFLTLNLLALLLAAWKAPAWVKEVGVIALVVGVLGFLIGWHMALTSIIAAGEIATRIVWSGLQLAIITPTYGLIIYLVSLIIRLTQKPRI